MGLDISAYSNIKVLGTADEYDESLEDSNEFRQEFINPHFPHASVGYEGEFVQWIETSDTESTSFRAGSYSGYGLFRSSLADEFLGTTDLYMDSPHRGTANGDWEKVHASEGKPFYELINFSDCEGVIIGPACTKLYNDFVTHREAYVNSLDETDHQWGFVKRYDDWTEAFRLASQNGLVSFH